MTSSGVAFKSLAHLERWLETNHRTKTELWVRIYKKNTGTPSVTWQDCVEAGLVWGWIDSQRLAFDDHSFLQRLTPRRAKSTWSKKNCEHAERLIAEGRMRPSGVEQVEAAKRDGRWDRAYSGAKNMVIPADFLAAVAKNAAANKVYVALDRANLFAIYFRLTNAKRAETRARRIDALVAGLARGELPRGTRTSGGE